MIPMFNECVIRTVDDLLEKVDSIEKYVRHSKEYRFYLKYMKEELKLRSCNFFCNVDFVDNDLSLELHHIITLYDLCVLAGRKLLDKLKEGEFLTTFDVAKEVIMMHFNDWIPVVMLSKTIHEMVHANLYELKPHTPMINVGIYTSFVKAYGKYLLPDHYIKYKELGVNLT